MIIDHCPTIADLVGDVERPVHQPGEAALDSIRLHGICPHCRNFDTALDAGIDFNRCINAAQRWVEEKKQDDPDYFTP